MIQNSETTKRQVSAPLKTKRSGNHAQKGVTGKRAKLAAAIASARWSNTGVPVRRIRGLTSGAAARAARPATAVFRPIQVSETPRASIHSESSGVESDTPKPTTAMQVIAAAIP